jgi:hypothetical protein
MFKFKTAEAKKVLLEHYKFKDIREAKKQEKFKNLKAQDIYD